MGITDVVDRKGSESAAGAADFAVDTAAAAGAADVAAALAAAVVTEMLVLLKANVAVEDGVIALTVAVIERSLSGLRRCSIGRSPSSEVQQHSSAAAHSETWPCRLHMEQTVNGQNSQFAGVHAAVAEGELLHKRVHKHLRYD